MPHLERERAPLYEALLKYNRQNNRTYHVPGHKNGQVYELELDCHDRYDGMKLEQQKLRDMMALDVTEITGTDDLHHPEGVIQEAQILAADCFGAEETHFLVNGSTVGNIALILTCCTEPGDVLIVQRNVHKSILHGLMLAGARAVFVTPQLDAHSGLPTAPSAAAVTEALQRYPAAKGVLLCSPNYYGMGVDVRALVQIVHKHGLPLLVDEAHGAHYGLHPELPESALQCGADGVVQSTHKMLSSLTQSAMLHVQGPLIDRALLKQRLTMLQSSSPSYLLMASLDVSRRWVHVQREGAFRRGLEVVTWLRLKMKKLHAFEVISYPTAQPYKSEAAYKTLDPFKVTVSDRTGSLTGYQLQEHLESYGCIPEMSDLRYVVLVFTLGSTMEDAYAVYKALEQIERQLIASLGDVESVTQIEEPITSHVVNDTPAAPTAASVSQPISFDMKPMSPDDWEVIPLADASHRYIAEMVIPYPPGIPLLYPGEQITDEMLHILQQLAYQEAKCQGVQDPKLHTLRVLLNR